MIRERMALKARLAAVMLAAVGLLLVVLPVMAVALLGEQAVRATEALVVASEHLGIRAKSLRSMLASGRTKGGTTTTR